MYKVFNENSHIVAIKTTGNVFSYEVGIVLYYIFVNTLHTYILGNIFSLNLQAIEELNLKTKNFKDLLTSEPFTRKDIITIQVFFSVYVWFLKILIFLYLCYLLHDYFWT